MPRYTGGRARPPAGSEVRDAMGKAPKPEDPGKPERVVLPGGGAKPTQFKKGKPLEPPPEPEASEQDHRRAWVVGTVLLTAFAGFLVWLALRPGAGDVPGLIQGLTHEDLEVRTESAAAIVDIGRPAVPVLLRALEEGPVRRRATVAAFFGNVAAISHNPAPFRGPDVDKALDRAVRSQHWPIRGSALMGWLMRGRWTKETAERVLAVYGEAAYVRRKPPKDVTQVQRDAADLASRAAWMFLMNMTPELIDLMPVFLDGLRSENPYVVGLSIKLLGAFGPAAERALPKLEALYEQEQETYPLTDTRTFTKRRVDPACHLGVLEEAMAKIRGEDPPGRRRGG